MSFAGPHARQNADPDPDAAPKTAPQADPNASQNVVEAYAFACMNCGYGWEQRYEIAHRTDSSGRTVVTYLVDGAEVPSPLTRPTCQNCEGHLLRILRPGQVADATSPHVEGKDVLGHRKADEPPPPGTAHRHSPFGFLHRGHDTGAGPPR